MKGVARESKRQPLVTYDHIRVIGTPIPPIHVCRSPHHAIFPLSRPLRRAIAIPLEYGRPSPEGSQS
jgi:hypothetical protein